jgi:protein-S-isoprenylcysteine O-methyltransferase Ste14
MFFRAGTTTNPIKPEKTSTLVTRGVLGLTRNPMYLSLVFYLVAWAVYLSNWATLLLVPAFMLYITRFQIVPEERFLSGRYGAEYIAYQARVRRWL